MQILIMQYVKNVFEKNLIFVKYQGRALLFKIFSWRAVPLPQWTPMVVVAGLLWLLRFTVVEAAGILPL